MERYDKVLAEISVATSELKITSVQEVLKLSKQNVNITQDFWDKVSEILWTHLQTGFKIFDDQLLCATCFFTVLPRTNKQDIYLTQLLQMIDKELIIKKDNAEKSPKTCNVVSMMYGIYQSTFLTQKSYNNVPQITSVLNSIYELLLLMGYEYSQYTFISFKTMKLYKKVQGTVFQDCIFNREKQIKLLNFVNHNWENPVTGIRDLNRSIFQILLSVLDDELYDTLLKEVNGFYWNKAKYLMLSEIIEHKNKNLFSLAHDYLWVDGLIYSLHKPGLVSAGADMYYALLKQTNFDTEWCKLFLDPVIKMLNGSSSKAIENFHNFWCLITMKKFPTVPQILINELKEHIATEQNLCSQLCVMKQANKLSLLEKDWSSSEDFGHIEKTTLIGIGHCNYYMRMLAFDIVCVSQKKLVPSQLEYDLILDFLYENVNSDCTVLRLSMLNSLNNFLTQLHSVFLNVMVQEDNTEDLLEFCKKMQNFIVDSLKLNGNYQRNITCVKLCNAIISCFSEIPNKKKGQTRQANITLIEYVKKKGCWLLSADEFVLKLVSLLRSPTDDVRENAIRLLQNHFSEELRKPNIMQHLVDGALSSMKSKFFYVISCGQSMFKLITYLIIRDKHSIAEYKNVEDIFYFAYNQLISEHNAKTNIMKSIETGKQLHSFMNILLVVIETCIIHSYKINIHSNMLEFVNVMGSISNQFAWEEESSTSSDFSKMNEMVENIIGNSGVSLGDDTDHTKISGYHQIVLNSLWLNVKASSDLASILVQLNENDASVCEKCLNIITHVLETSRHKGAIEAAGASLGKAIQYLTSLPEENEASEVPNKLLKCKLNDLISETNKMASITRRGAGLSIMVHRIVSSDMKKGKPLFHYFINTLLEVCNATRDTPKKNDENQIDLPKAIYIHFMTRIVTDSSLASDMMFYFAKLAELAFANLTSPHWQIRNAALQLYGALIPKQIGEKKASGSDEQTTATVACDELRTHSPKLWKYIMLQLKLNHGPDTVQSHSNLVPILNLVANSAKRYSFSYDIADKKASDDELLKNLFLLLNSPLHTVRRLTAKCIFNIHAFEDIHNVLLNHTCLSENYLHGSLILINLCHKYYSPNKAYEEHFERLRNKYKEIFCNRNHSYLSKRLYEDIFVNNFNFEGIEKTIFELNDNLHSPGVNLWAEARLKKFINVCSWDEILALLKIILKQSHYEKYIEFIFLRIKTNHAEKEVLLKMVEVLLSFENKFCSCITWNILYEISLQTDLSGYLDAEELLKNICEKESIYILRYIIPLLARNISSISNDNKLILMKIIQKLSNFDNSDVDMRCIAATANNEVANEFYELPDSTKVTSTKCAIMLLQDEDEDVRNLSVHFYHRLSKDEVVVQPYICLRNILNSQFLSKMFGSEILVKKLLEELSEILNVQSSQVIDEYNPFANNSKNIYFEPDVLRQMIENLNTV
ncbi:uncharacterized protein LOC124636193 [Helicoverpa zea]|uniref:uncharacterized protein LOC124636193 n=1 Tax=Helicoverpa zea TaxID=7113 RepID=UPI001F57C41A|nr:uncharacterized protein LOC124636193 [Helicoverpa zea]